MRRNISLYIADRLVDLSDESFILYNYTLEDLTNPTIVKNSFSQQITLKGTPGNNAIFGNAYRLDRYVGQNGGQAGSDFNPSAKTPFSIYNEKGEILESGYAKLDSVTTKGHDVEYKVTLYGGLGSFLYALSYDEEGNKRTLADLDYLGVGNSATELDFIINTTSVRDAWSRLPYASSSITSKWDVINFAPAYNGVPDGNFAADKGVVVPTQVGLSKTISKDGKTYTTRNGYALVNLAQKHDEWAVKDMRSYLQRPVLSIRAFLAAIAKPANNGGYIVNKSVLDDTSKFDYGRIWMTLPMLPSISVQQTTGDLSLTLSSTKTTSIGVGSVVIQGSVPSGTKVSADIRTKLIVGSTYAASTLSRQATRQSDRLVEKVQSVIFAQAVAYGSGNDSMVGGSKVLTFYDGNLSAEAIAARCGYTPVWQDGDQTFAEKDGASVFTKVSGGYEFERELAFQVDALDVQTYIIYVKSYKISESYYVGNPSSTEIKSITGGTSCVPILYQSYTSSMTGNGCYLVDNGSSVSYTSSSSLRSGAKVSKKMLLSSSNTPADYLLSFCKMFGLYLLYDSARKAVTILRRNDLYQDSVIDLSKRVDMSKGVSIQPFAFTSKWYDFKLQGTGGAYYDEYLAMQGREYGIQRVNTGYDFNSEVKNLMESVVFKNACSVLARSRYFNVIIDGGNYLPSTFLDKGNTYTLWASDGTTLETEISCPSSSANISYYNSKTSGYDKVDAAKMEFHDAEGKPIDGSNVLLYYSGSESYQSFALTDDLPLMDLLNDGVPCWILNPSSSFVSMPLFGGYLIGNGQVNKSLDFGLPNELDIPGVRYEADKTIYAKQWKNYLSDRYNVNTKVMTCHVNLAGLQVNAGLLRKFYWFGNSLWVLNAIKNYSLTTYDPVECEFVQVQNKSNYLNGQI